MKLPFLTILLTMCLLTTNAQIPAWFVKLKKLQEFPSTKKDIERLFKSPRVNYSTPSEEIKQSDSWIKVIKYDLPEGELQVLFSAGKCSDKNIYGYNLDDGVVINYYFKLKNLIPVKKLKLNLNKYVLTKAIDTEQRFYKDSKKGVTYTVLGEKLQHINFTIPNSETFGCENILKNSRNN